MTDYKTCSIEKLNKDIANLLKLQEFLVSKGDELCAINMAALSSLQEELLKRYALEVENA